MNPGCLELISSPQTFQSSNSPLSFLFGFTTSDQQRKDLEKDMERLIGIQSERDSIDSKALVLFLQIGGGYRDFDLE